MALVFVEGFEADGATGHQQRRYASIVNTGSADDPRVIGTRRSWSSANFQVETKALVPSLVDDWVVGFALYTEGDMSASQTLFKGFTLRDATGSGGDQIQLALVGISHLATEIDKFKVEVRRGATVLGTSDATLLRNRWYYVELKVTIHASAGSFEVRIDGVSDAGATDVGPVNTANQGTAGADRLFLNWDSDPDNVIIRYDDIYADAGGTNFLGPLVVETQESESGEGTNSDWNLEGGATSSGQALKDQDNTVATADEDRRITSDVIGEVTTVNYPALAVIRDGTIRGANVRTLLKMETSGQRDVEVRYRDNTGTPGEVSGTPHTIASTSFEIVEDYFATNPEKGGAFTPAQLDVAEWGVRVDA